jgi:ATP-dependent Lon protease
MALGGVRDESEIRGHRKTYIGSMPGKVLQNMTKVGVKNPLFLLDEVDKMGQDFRGDPSSALLEVLDPEQNHTFIDHYAEVEYDLSNVMFVATANTLNIPEPLLDRMEIIRLAGYTEQEKIDIASAHLVPKQLKAHGLKKAELVINKSAVKSIIQFYTREAGVRKLEQEIAKICRKAVKKLLTMKKVNKISVSSLNIDEYLGVKIYDIGLASKKNQIGQVTGLAWTQVGGELLTIETIIMPGKGKINLTGKLGDVMKESIHAALSVVRSRSDKLNIPIDFYEKNDIHIHLPEAATPKDGPSAGIGMTTGIISALTGIPVRSDVAMTGEITLRGEVLPIGGLKEKLLAAHRGGIKKVLIPHLNAKDLIDISQEVLKKIEVIPVKSIDEVLKIALTKDPETYKSKKNKDHKKSIAGQNLEKVDKSIAH